MRYDEVAKRVLLWAGREGRLPDLSAITNKPAIPAGVAAMLRRPAKPRAGGRKSVSEKAPSIPCRVKKAYSFSSHFFTL